jgi:hypothetical protein
MQYKTWTSPNMHYSSDKKGIGAQLLLCCLVLHSFGIFTMQKLVKRDKEYQFCSWLMAPFITGFALRATTHIVNIDHIIHGTTSWWLLETKETNK